jgi:hypothetical protein
MDKWANELNKWLLKEVQMANKYVKKYSASLVVREVQIKTTLKFHLTLVRMVSIKKTSFLFIYSLIF